MAFLKKKRNSDKKPGTIPHSFSDNREEISKEHSKFVFLIIKKAKIRTTVPGDIAAILSVLILQHQNDQPMFPWRTAARRK